MILPFLHDSQVLYLVQNRNNTPRIWQHCTAALFPPYLRLSFSHPPPGTPLTYSINLSACVEVHSVAANKIEPGMIPAVQGQDSVHVFEMELEGGAKETFAAASIKDRGMWVSSIW